MKRSKLLLSIMMLAAPATMAATAPATPGTTPAQIMVYCPKPSDLKKDPTKLTWSADRNTFRSYDISFSTKIDKFTGAQWVGANVGQITCVYKTFPKTSFPVLLIFHTLTLTPKGDAWSKNLGGYKNCNSIDRKDCPFIVRLRHRQVNVYQEAESLKSSVPEPPTE